MEANIEPAARPVHRRPDDAEIRVVPLEGIEVRDSGKSAGEYTIRGHASVFNRLSLELSDGLGTFREKIASEAFDRVLEGNPDVWALWDHSTTHVLGRSKNKTLELRIDPVGLHYWVRAAKTSYAADLRALLERGDIDQASFAFTVANGGEEWHMDGDQNVVRTIHEIGDLYDVTVTAMGAYPQTDSSIVRSLRQRVAQSAESPIKRRMTAIVGEATARLWTPGSSEAFEGVRERNVAPAEPADNPSPQFEGELDDGEQRNLASETVGDDSSHETVGEKTRVSSLERDSLLDEMAEAVAVAKEQKREFEKRKYELKARKD